MQQRANVTIEDRSRKSLGLTPWMPPIPPPAGGSAVIHTALSCAPDTNKIRRAVDHPDWEEMIIRVRSNLPITKWQRPIPFIWRIIFTSENVMANRWSLKGWIINMVTSPSNGAGYLGNPYTYPQYWSKIRERWDTVCQSWTLNYETGTLLQSNMANSTQLK